MRYHFNEWGICCGLGCVSEVSRLLSVTKRLSSHYPSQKDSVPNIGHEKTQLKRKSCFWVLGDDALIS